eukprot:scaffold60_cov325-Pavlova_lutheri.AAC.3
MASQEVQACLAQHFSTRKVLEGWDVVRLAIASQLAPSHPTTTVVCSAWDRIINPIRHTLVEC